MAMKSIRLFSLPDFQQGFASRTVLAVVTRTEFRIARNRLSWTSRPLLLLKGLHGFGQTERGELGPDPLTTPPRVDFSPLASPGERVRLVAILLRPGIDGIPPPRQNDCMLCASTEGFLWAPGPRLVLRGDHVCFIPGQFSHRPELSSRRDDGHVDLVDFLPPVVFPTCIWLGCWFFWSSFVGGAFARLAPPSCSGVFLILVLEPLCIRGSSF